MGSDVAHRKRFEHHLDRGHLESALFGEHPCGRVLRKELRPDLGGAHVAGDREQAREQPFVLGIAQRLGTAEADVEVEVEVEVEQEHLLSTQGQHECSEFAVRIVDDAHDPRRRGRTTLREQVAEHLLYVPDSVRAEASPRLPVPVDQALPCGCRPRLEADGGEGLQVQGHASILHLSCA